MLSLIIASMMALSLVMAGTYVAYTAVDSSQRVSDVQRNSAQMWQLAALIQANLRPVKGDSVLYPPAPALTDDGLTVVPSWLAPGARTPWGAAYGYCVYAPEPQAVAPELTTTDYPYAGAPGAHAFVATAPALPEALAGRDIVALIIAPPLKSTQPARCADVTLDQDQPALTGGGQVVAIGQRATNDLAALSAAARIERFVTESPQGTGTGTTLANGMSLEAALGLWLAVRPNTLVLRLAAGQHSLGAALLTALADDDATPEGGRLVLAALESGAVITSSAAAAVFQVPAELRIDGVSFERVALAAQPGRRLELRGQSAITAPAGVPAVRATGATLIIGGTLSTVSDTEAIRLEGGQALVRDGRLNARVGRGSSAIVATLGAGLTFSAASRRPQLAVSGNGTPLAAIRAGGSATILDHADVALYDGTQFGVILEGGSLEMSASALGLANARAASGGVLDLGGLRVAGDAGVQIWTQPGARCTQGVLFTQTSPGQTTVGVSGLVQANSVANRANWTCRN